MIDGKVLQMLRDYTNHIFHRLTVVSYVGINKHRKKVWACLCECGNQIDVMEQGLIYNRTKSCGCLRVDSNSKKSTTHGATKTREYSSWHAAKSRCYNENNPSYEYYGASGITMCDEWKNSFETFLKDMGSRPPKTSLERINNKLGYSRTNCRWASNTDQLRNTRRTVLTVELAKEIKRSVKSITELSILFGVSKSAISGVRSGRTWKDLD